MMVSLKSPLSLKSLLAILCTVSVTFPLHAANQSSTAKYLVLKISNQEGKISFKAVAEKEQDSFKKTLDEEFSRTKKTWEEEKKAFQKETPGKKFEKPAPQRPKILSTAKRDLKSYNEAMQVALNLDREQAKAKNGKNGNGNGTSKATENADKVSGNQAAGNDKGSEKTEKNGKTNGNEKTGTK